MKRRITRGNEGRYVLKRGGRSYVFQAQLGVILKLGNEITESRWKQHILTVPGKPNTGTPCDVLASLNQKLLTVGFCLCSCFLICLSFCLCLWCPINPCHDLLFSVHHLCHVGKMRQQEVRVKPHKVASHMHTRDLQRKEEIKLKSEKKFSHKFGPNDCHHHGKR